MAGNVMAIMQEIDKCIRCNGCYIACKRTWKMDHADFKTRGQHRLAPHQRVVIKSLKKTDMGPFVRYSCWHCENPPCAGRCPFKAIVKRPNGAVDVIFHDDGSGNFCQPGATNAKGQKCLKQCVTDCQRGGFPKVGVGNLAGEQKAFKCVMCSTRAGHVDPVTGLVAGDLPTKIKKDSQGRYASELYQRLVDAGASVTGLDPYVPEMAHQPACVQTCPAKAMHWDTKKNVAAYTAYVQAHGGYFVGGNSMWWVTSKSAMPTPKADPFVEDHVAPMVSGLLSNPLVATAIVPTLVVGGLLAVSARRAENEKQASLAMEGEV